MNYKVVEGHAFRHSEASRRNHVISNVLERKSSDLQTNNNEMEVSAKRQWPLAVWAVALATWIACCVTTIRSGETDIGKLALLSIFSNFQNIPGLLVTTLSTNRGSAFRLWNATTIFIALPGLGLWTSEAFQPKLTEVVTGPMAGFSLLPFVLGFYILCAYGIFILVASFDLLTRK